MASTRGEMAGWWYQADVAAFSSSDAFARDTRAIGGGNREIDLQRRPYNQWCETV